MRPPRGPTDPGRREKIARAAIAVIAESGVEGLTHRAVAKAAGVPLGSTTYHFADREAMLEAAMLEAAEAAARGFRTWAEGIAPEDDLVDALVEMLVRDTSLRRDRIVVGYELYVAALKRPALRPAAMKWLSILRIELERFVDPVTAAALAAASEGIMLSMLASGEAVRSSEAETILRRIHRGSKA
ncbi:MAG: TetR/AcrR family transcriptional regulator [Solirubrobacterales bacterium]